MCPKIIIKDKNPILTLCSNPYAYGLFKKEEDFQLEILEINEHENYILLRKKINGIIGYAFVVQINDLNAEIMKKTYNKFKNFVSEIAHNNFREFELVIITQFVDNEVTTFINEYNNRYSHRPPIRLIFYKV